MSAPRRLRLGMVGGGDGAFIGAVHRMAARLDDEWALVAGAFSSDPQRSAASAQRLRIEPSRSHADYRAMARAEAALRDAGGDAIDAVAIVTPNHLHAPVAHAFLDAGIDVICDKPLALTLEEGIELQRRARQLGRRFFVTYNYSGYPMVRRARQLVREGALGALRLVQVEYAQDWLAAPIEASGHKQASWRTDPRLAGAGCLGDIATHAYHLACFVTGLQAEAISAEVRTVVPGRGVDDHVQAHLRFAGGVSGSLWASQVAAGALNGLHWRVCGEHASLAWHQEEPELLRLRRVGGDETILRRGRSDAGAPPGVDRLPAGHPEGFVEAFAQLYRDAAASIRATPIDELPTVADGVRGLAFVEAARRSSAGDGRWTPIAA